MMPLHTGLRLFAGRPVNIDIYKKKWYPKNSNFFPTIALQINVLQTCLFFFFSFWLWACVPVIKKTIPQQFFTLELGTDFLYVLELLIFFVLENL